MCGIFIYVVTWVLLGQESEEGISPNLKREFTVRLPETRVKDFDSNSSVVHSIRDGP